MTVFSALHPATRIVCWMAFAVLVPRLPVVLLAAASMVLSALLAFGAWPSFVRLAARARWLLVSLVLIYAWATPGEAVFAIPLSPSGAGLQAGALQAWRLALMLAALALLLAGAAKQELLEGLYCLMRPFKRLGFAPERAAARLWLTLHYAEAPASGGTLAQRLQAAFAPSAADAAPVVIEHRPFTWRDGAAGVLLALLAAALLL